MTKTKRNIISFLNMKGGVSKTTLCREIAVFLHEVRNKKILIIDIDPQSNCTQSLFERYDIYSQYSIDINENKLIKQIDCKKLPSIENIFSKSDGYLSNNDLSRIIQRLSNKKNGDKEVFIDLIPGHLDTIFMERDIRSGSAESMLKYFIEKEGLRNTYDYIFIDCPPTYSFYTIASTLASDFYLVPVKPDAYSLLGLDLLEKVIRDLKLANQMVLENKPIDNLGAIFTMVGDNIGYKNNVLQIEAYLKTKDIYTFKNQFAYYPKIATANLSKFIVDRGDSKLYEMIEYICSEFEERMGEYNECNRES